MEHAVGLAETERTQDDGLGLVGTSSHGPASLVLRVEGTSVPAFYVVTPMARVRVYSTRWCAYCVRARALLDARGIEYEDVSLDDDPAFRQKLFELTGGWTVPQIVADGRPIGGYAELWRLDREGRLVERLAA